MEPKENKDGSEVLETTETEEETVETPDEEKEALKREKEELENKNKQLYERLKKLENKPSDTDGLSSKDVIFLAKTDIHEEDIAEVTDLAKLKKISVAEAYKYLKPVLDVREEERKTAQATQTKGGRGTSTTKPEELLRRASQGQIPQDDEGIEALVAAREAQRIGGE